MKILSVNLHVTQVGTGRENLGGFNLAVPIAVQHLSHTAILLKDRRLLIAQGDHILVHLIPRGFEKAVLILLFFGNNEVIYAASAADRGSHSVHRGTLSLPALSACYRKVDISRFVDAD